MIRKFLIVVSLGVVTLAATTACADFADDNFQAALREIRDLRAQMQRLEKKMDRILSRLDQLEKERPVQSGTDATKRDERLKRHGFPALEPIESVDDILRLQFEAPNQLLDGLREREERLRRRPFPAELNDRR